jgi:MFS family permease
MPRVTPAWKVVFALMFMQTVSSGLGFYNMSVYVSELASQMQAPLASLSFAVSLFFIAGGIAGIYVARLMDRVDIRWIMVGGALTGGIALAGVGFVDRLPALYAMFILFGLGNTGVSLVVSTTLITRWFPGPERAVALSVASTGLSLGGVTLTPLTALLFNSIGVPATMPWLGLMFFFLVLPLALFVIKMPVQAVGVVTDGAQLIRGYRHAIRQRFFVMLSLGYLSCMAAQVGGIAHLYGRIENLADFSMASYGIQTLSICSILGRFAGGWIAARIQIRTFTLGAICVQAVGLLLMSIASGPAAALFATALFGLSVGNLLMSQPLWLAHAYSGEVYPRVFAMANALSVIGVAAGPFFMGWAVDGLDYKAAFLLAFVFSVLACVFFIFSGTVRLQTESNKG